MKLCAINIGHSSSISFFDGSYHTIEFERLLKERYCDIANKKTTPYEMKQRIQLALDVAYREWGIDNGFDKLGIISPTKHQIEDMNYNDFIIAVEEVIHAKEYIFHDHHRSHAACAFYQSPYDEAIIISYDGSGNDGVFNVYHGSDDGISLISALNINSLGKIYRIIGLSCGDIKKEKRKAPIPGKLMGLCAYGDVREEWVDSFMAYERTRDVDRLSANIGVPLITEFVGNRLGCFDNTLQHYGKVEYDIAATHQYAFEQRVLELIAPYVDKLPICITGGCALNVLVNEKIRRIYGDRIFIPPNPDDSGLALGQLFLMNSPASNDVKHVVYTGLPILDMESMMRHVNERNARQVDMKEIVNLLMQGKIIGICRGNSELGPRALGNRSIICDPSYAGMKDKINRIKQREWYRPFAPMVRYEDREKYFDFTHESQFMSFAPLVRKEYIDKIPSVVHVDGTARLQTVHREQNEFIHDLLTEFGSVLLNTSFNVRGKPMLTTIEDALEVLDTTELDYVYIDGYLF